MKRIFITDVGGGIKPKGFMAVGFVLAAFVVLSAGLLTYVVLTKQQSSLRQISLTNTNQPPSSSADETKNWQIYRNEQYGFEFKYPENLNLAITKLENRDVGLEKQNHLAPIYMMASECGSRFYSFDDFALSITSPSQIFSISLGIHRVMPGQKIYGSYALGNDFETPAYKLLVSDVLNIKQNILASIGTTTGPETWPEVEYLNLWGRPTAHYILSWYGGPCFGVANEGYQFFEDNQLMVGFEAATQLPFDNMADITREKVEKLHPSELFKNIVSTFKSISK